MRIFLFKDFSIAVSLTRTRSPGLKLKSLTFEVFLLKSGRSLNMRCIYLCLEVCQLHVPFLQGDSLACYKICGSKRCFRWGQEIIHLNNVDRQNRMGAHSNKIWWASHVLSDCNSLCPNTESAVGDHLDWSPSHALKIASLTSKWEHSTSPFALSCSLRSWYVLCSIVFSSRLDLWGMQGRYLSQFLEVAPSGIWCHVRSSHPET